MNYYTTVITDELNHEYWMMEQNATIVNPNPSNPCKELVAYPDNALPFEHALAAMKAGKRVKRAGWIDGNCLWIYQRGETMQFEGTVSDENGENPIEFALTNEDLDINDILATDWQIVEGE